MTRRKLARDSGAGCRHGVQDRPAIGILVVDREEAVREALCKWFAFDGCRVGACADAFAALDILRLQGHWDIVVAGVPLPGMDSVTLLRRIGRIDETLVTVVMTAPGLGAAGVQALEAGAFAHVVKPIDPEDMSRVIRSAARQCRIRGENRRTPGRA